VAVDTLRSNSSTSTDVANALSLYISSTTDTNTTLNSIYTLTPNQIDTYTGSINNVNLTIDTTDSFLLATPPTQNGNVIVLGASFTHDIGGEVVNTFNENGVLSSDFSAAAIVSNESLVDVTSLNMLIIDTPSAYTNIDNSSNKTLASSVIVAAVQRNNLVSTSMNISLYFQVPNEYKPNVSAKYLCSFYDPNTSQWNESGCTAPFYNQQFNRYECSCNHLTSFALLWLPQSLSTNNTRALDAQDIASIVFQSISIISFIAVIIHAIYIRIRNPLLSVGAYDLTPLLSCASTTILFIFDIALGITVYMKTSSANETQCFLSASVLMFFVYFFVIFMFCVKTSVGYFNYLRFVRLFPQPSLRKLYRMLLISFFISITWVAFAAGFNSNSLFKITQLYPYKLCWFTRDVVYYFLIIPACLFILMTTITFVLVSIHIIKHVRSATSSHQLYVRMKRCVIVLLSSCITQGIGWLFGPFITFSSVTAGNVLGWIFIVFNGLEGLWSIILYLIIQSQRIDEPKRVQAAREFFQQKYPIPDEYKISPGEDNKRESGIRRRNDEVEYRNRQEGESHPFYDLPDLSSIDRSVDDDIVTSYF
jgi:hypothetical protein